MVTESKWLLARAREESIDAYPADRRTLVRCGAELVELSERFYRAIFIGAVVFVALASIAALALLPLRQSVPPGGPPATVVLAVLLVVAASASVWRAGAAYRLVRRWTAIEVALVAIAAALVVYPLNSELWWPSCALVMLLATIVPLRRTATYCAIVLIANLASHLADGDLSHTPAVAIIGLWIGFPFWAATFALITERLVGHILWLNATPTTPLAPLRVGVWAPVASSETTGRGHDEPPASPSIPGHVPALPPEAGVIDRLTARQLQVVALLADGLRYADVAACLSISVRQVERHVANAIARAGVRSVNELVAAAAREGLVPKGDRMLVDGA
jgi:DNA-binding CsgD family transcriptional regulator